MRLRQATHRPTGQQLGRVRLSQSCHRQHLLSQRCLKRKPKPAKHGPFQRMGLSLQDCWMLQDWSQQILGNLGVHLQAFAGWTSSFSSRLCRATALETFLKLNAVYEIYIDLSSMAQEQGSTRCRHPRTHTHKHGVGWKEHSADIISDTFLPESDMGNLTKGHHCQCYHFPAGNLNGRGHAGTGAPHVAQCREYRFFHGFLARPMAFQYVQSHCTVWSIGSCPRLAHEIKIVQHSFYRFTFIVIFFVKVLGKPTWSPCETMSFKEAG